MKARKRNRNMMMRSQQRFVVRYVKGATRQERKENCSEQEKQRKEKGSDGGTRKERRGKEERKGKEMERKGMERNGKERNGTERERKERKRNKTGRERKKRTRQERNGKYKGKAELEELFLLGYKPLAVGRLAIRETKGKVANDI